MFTNNTGRHLGQKRSFLKLTTPVMVALLIFTALAPNASAVTDNLIPNGSAETASVNNSALPDGWSTFTNGSPFTFAYPVAGFDGGRAVAVSRGVGIGFGAWRTPAAAYSPGTKYVFSDRYKANVPTNVYAVYSLSNGRVRNIWLGYLPAVTTWTDASFTFIAPARTGTVSFQHRLNRRGTLTTDDYMFRSASVVPPPPPPPAPTIAISQPTNGATVSGTVNVTATVADTAGTVRFYLDNSPFGAEDNSAPYTASFISDTIANGSHSLMARLFYGSNQTLDSATVNVKVDNTVVPPPAPAITITGPANGATVSGTVAVTVALANTTGTVRAYLDGAEVGVPDNSAPYSFSFASGSFANGPHSLTARVFYGTTQTLDSAPVGITIDNPVIPPPPPPAPTIAITAPTGGSNVSGTIDITAAVSNTAGTVRFYLADTEIGTADNSAPYSTSFNTATVANGLHSIIARLFYGTDQTLDSAPVALNFINPTVPPPPPPPPPSSTELIINPALETAAGNAPENWFQGGWGTNNATFAYPVPGRTGVGAQVTMTSYTDGDAKWYFADVPVEAGKQYAFSDYYRSDAPTNVTVRYNRGSENFEYIGLADLPAAPDWQRYETIITVPAGVAALTVFHVLNGAGTLTVDDFSLREGSSGPSADSFASGLVSLTFDDAWISQYSTAYPAMQAAGFKGTFYVETVDALSLDTTLFFHPNEILAMAAAGHEIGAHSRNHPSLPTLTPTQLNSEVQGAKDDILGMGVSTVVSFAYPYGDYNQTVIGALQSAGFGSGRSVDRGFNTRSTNPYTLKIQEMNNQTTLAEVKGWIETANRDKTWLILMFHQVDNGSEQYAVTPAMFNGIVNYLQTSGTSVVTVAQGMAQMNP